MKFYNKDNYPKISGIYPNEQKMFFEKNKNIIDFFLFLFIFFFFQKNLNLFLYFLVKHGTRGA